MENINIYVDEIYIKENMLYVDIKCNCEKWFWIYIFLKDFEIYMVWVIKRYSWVYLILIVFVYLFLFVWYICLLKLGE